MVKIKGIEKKLTRRDFLNTGLKIGAGLIIAPTIFSNYGCGGGGGGSGEDSDGGSNPDPTNPKPVIIQLDDLQAWWLEDVASRLVNMHIGKGVPVTLGVIPENLHYREGEPNGITENLKTWHNNSRNLVEIAAHTYNHEDYSTWDLNQQVEDIKKGKQALNDLGIETTTFVPAHSWGNEYTAQAIVDAGMKIGMDGLDNPYIDSSNNPMILEDGIWHEKDVNSGNYNSVLTSDKYFSNWDFAALEPRLDDKIENRGYVLISYHQQDFEGALDSEFDQLANFLQELKDSPKYSVMTSEQYYHHVNG